MAASIDEAMNNLHVNGLVLYASMILPMYRWFVYCMFLNSGCWACSKFPGLILLPQFPGGLKNLLLSTHRRFFDFWFRITELPVSWCLADSFLSLSFTGLTRDPKLDEEMSSLHWLCMSRITGLAFCCRRATIRGCSLTSFRQGTKHYTLSNMRESFWNCYKNTSRNSLYWTNKESDSIHFRETSSISASLVFGVNIFDLDHGFQVDSVEQPNKSDSVSPWHVSHRWTSSFYYHFDHGFVVFKNVQRDFALRWRCVCGYIIHFSQLLNQ